MIRMQVIVCVLAIALIGTVSPKKSESLSPTCPASCRCITTAEGLHKASCSNLHALQKYAQLNKHHNINIIDLSYSNITKLSDELNAFTEIVTLDLSHNNIETLNKLLPNSKKLVHLNLKNNVLRTFSASSIPSSVSSLDLRNNHLTDVPSELNSLGSLEHLLLKANPLDCSCSNVRTLSVLRRDGVLLDDVVCNDPTRWNGQIWSEIKLNETCKFQTGDGIKADELMLADDPVRDLSAGKVFETDDTDDNPDDKEFLDMGVRSTTPEPEEGSGMPFNMDEDSLHISDSENNTDGSGEGSGFMPIIPIAGEDYDYASGDYTIETTTIAPLYTINKPFLGFESEMEPVNDTMFSGRGLGIFMEPVNWDESDDNKTRIEEPDDDDNPPDVEKPIEKTEASTEGTLIASEDNLGEVKPKPETPLGTYICVSLILLILIGLIVITLVRGRMRKNKERRTLRIQPRDVERADKEMVDMNKSLLGKPAVPTPITEKKMNGNYEMVPTHDTKKNGNADKNRNSLEVPSMTDMQKVAPVLNGSHQEPEMKESAPPLSQTQPPIPLTPIRTSPNYNGYDDRDYPGDHSPTLLPPDSGIVKIKLSETQKPKTPVLVTRSRSNAGDIIITPVGNQSLPSFKSP